MIPKNKAARAEFAARLTSALPVAALLTLLASALIERPAHADDYFSPTDERVRLSLGVIYASSATSLRADSRAGAVGTYVSGEEDFGLDKSNFEPKFQAVVRVAARHRLSFDYFTLDRTGNSTVESPIAFRDVTFVPGDPLQTTLNLRTFGITYEYSFWHTEKLEIAGTLGVHATDISAEAKVQTQSRHIIQTEDQAGPVPTLGIDATWVVSRRFYLDGRAQYLNVHVDNIGGSLGFYELDALYRIRPNVSFAVGYTEVKGHLASAQASRSGRFDFDTRGPEMFFRIAF